MSRKDYILLARALNRTLPPVAESKLQWQWFADVQSIADACQQFNPAFDRARFITACEKGSAK